MCGRYTLKTDPKMIAAQFSVSELAILNGAIADLTAPTAKISSIDEIPFRPNYNVAPTHQIPAILQHDDKTTLANFQWGLVPAWSKDPAIGSRMINARSETAAEKPSFRSAIVKRRCIVPADGWYEWHTNAGKKIPHYFSDPSETLLGFAGIYEDGHDDYYEYGGLNAEQIAEELPEALDEMFNISEDVAMWEEENAEEENIDIDLDGGLSATNEQEQHENK